MTTPLQLIALAGIKQNQGIGVSTALTTQISSWNAQTWVAQLHQAINIGGTPANVPFPANVAPLANSTLNVMYTIGSTTCPALADALPNTITNITVGYVNPGVTGLISNEANTVINATDLSKFCQAFSSATGYVSLTNEVINTSTNSNTYLGPTFTSMDSLTTGDVSNMNLALPAFGADLLKLGKLINLQNLGDLGSPAALLYQLFSQGGIVPGVQTALLARGIPQAEINNITDPNYDMADSYQKLAYQAMLTITGDTLEQVLAILDVTTANINVMADLLNPVKLFPTSFWSLTTATTVGIRGIYKNSSGTVNSNLEQQLPQYYIRDLAL
jgi:hypothetical protein